MKRKRSAVRRRQAPRKRTPRGRAPRSRRSGARAVRTRTVRRRRAASGRRRSGRPARRPDGGRPAAAIAPRRDYPYAGATPASLPAGMRAAAVISVRDEEDAIDDVLKELRKLPLQEIIVVVNGSTDGTLATALRHPEATVVHFADPLGHDVGRAVGARLASSDILLFVDGDFPVPAERLAPFLAAVHGGADVALNDIMPFLGPFRNWDDVSRVKAFMNVSLGRPELGANTMTSIPHALSRRALLTVGDAALMVPPKAQALAIMRGLKVVVCASVDVITHNRLRRTNTGGGNRVAGLIIGDHIEALRTAMSSGGTRLALKDDLRRRTAAGGERR